MLRIDILREGVLPLPSPENGGLMVLQMYEKMITDMHLKPTKEMSLKEVLLQSIYRLHVIQAVKEPLIMAIVLAWKLLPCKPKRENCRKRNTFLLIEFKEWFLERYDCKNRNEFMEAVLDIFITEYEHDDNYPDYTDLFVQFIAEKVNDGSWQPSLRDRPDPLFWKPAREAKNVNANI